MKINHLMIVVVLFLYSCSAQKNDEAKKETVTTQPAVLAADEVELTAAQISNAGITFGFPEQKEIHSALRLNGVIDVPPDNLVSVSIPMAGYIRKMNLIAGQKVVKGQVLATLEDQAYIQLQQDYLTAKNKLDFLQADYQRQETLNKTKAASDKVYQQAKADYESQKVLIKGLEEKLRLININPDKLTTTDISRSVHLYAPITGYVSKINVNAGRYVSPTDVLLDLVNPNDLHVSLTVFENDAVKIKEGQKITFATNADPQKKYNATVHLITPVISEESATEVHCDIEGVHELLIPGTFVNAELEINNASVLAVPEDAVVKWDSNYFVFLKQDSAHFKMFPVQTGTTYNGFTEIRSTLPADKSIVTKNAYTLLMKLKNSSDEE